MFFLILIVFSLLYGFEVGSLCWGCLFHVHVLFVYFLELLSLLMLILNVSFYLFSSIFAIKSAFMVIRKCLLFILLVLFCLFCLHWIFVIVVLIFIRSFISMQGLESFCYLTVVHIIFCCLFEKEIRNI